MKGARALFLVPLLGCSGSYIRMVMTPQRARQIDLHMNGGMCAGSDGAVFLVTSAGVTRYDPGENRIEDLLIDPTMGIMDVAMGPEEVPLVLCYTWLHALFAGKLVPIMELPGVGRRVSCRADAAFALVDGSLGESRLLRYSFAAHRLEGVLETKDRVADICAVRGGCLIAVGDSILKLFDPAKGEAESVLLCAVAGSRVSSVAADPDGEAVYFADKEVTYAWVEGAVIPLFPMGGELAYSAGTLTIASPTLLQVVQIVRPASRARRLVD